MTAISQHARLDEDETVLPFLEFLQSLIDLQPLRVKSQLLKLDAGRQLRLACLAGGSGSKSQTSAESIAKDICAQLLTLSQVAGFDFAENSRSDGGKEGPSISEELTVSEDQLESTYRGVPDRVLRSPQDRSQPDLSAAMSSPLPRISGYLPSNTTKKSVTFERREGVTESELFNVEGLFEWQFLLPSDLRVWSGLESRSGH